MDTAQQLAALLRRVDELESRAALRDLVSDYCIGFDKRNWERFLAIWWEDCVWDIGPPFGKFAGHAGITQAVKGVLWPVWRESHHLTSNLVVRFEGPDVAVRPSFLLHIAARGKFEPDRLSSHAPCSWSPNTAAPTTAADITPEPDPVNLAVL